MQNKIDVKLSDFSKLSLHLPLVLCNYKLFHSKYPVFAMLYYIPKKKNKMFEEALFKICRYPEVPFSEDTINCVYKGVKTSLMYANQTKKYNPGMDWLARIGINQWISLNTLMNIALHREDGDENGCTDLFVNYHSDPYMIVPTHFYIHHSPLINDIELFYQKNENQLLVRDPEPFYQQLKTSIHHWSYQMQGMNAEIEWNHSKKDIAFETLRNVQIEKMLSFQFQHYEISKEEEEEQKQQTIHVNKKREWENICMKQTKRSKAHRQEETLEEKETKKWNYFSEHGNGISLISKTITIKTDIEQFEKPIEQVQIMDSLDFSDDSEDDDTQSMTQNMSQRTFKSSKLSSQIVKDKLKTPRKKRISKKSFMDPRLMFIKNHFQKSKNEFQEVLI